MLTPPSPTPPSATIDKRAGGLQITTNMTATEAKQLLERIPRENVRADDLAFYDCMHARVKRGAELNAKQATWLRRMATELAQ